MRPRLALRSGLDAAACPGLWAIIKALTLDPGESCSEVPPLGSENASPPNPSMAVPAGGTNGANGFAPAIVVVDEDAGVVGVVWIGPLLPLPCGNGSNSDVDDTIAFGSIAVDIDVIVADMIDLLCHF